MPRQHTTLTIVIPPNLKTLVEQWAKDDDRSASAFMRRLIEAEAARRRKGQQQPRARREVEYRVD